MASRNPDRDWAKRLSSPWAYMQLAEFCLSHKRQGEALRYAEEGLWVFEDGRPDEGLLLFAVKLLIEADQKEDELYLWRAFEKQPSLNLYKQIRETGGEVAARRAQAQLEFRLGNGQRSTWRDGPDLDRDSIHEKDFGEAWAAEKKFGASVYTKEALVEASGTNFPNQAIEFYTSRVEQFASTGMYTEATKVISRMARLRSDVEQAAYVADLKAGIAASVIS